MFGLNKNFIGARIFWKSKSKERTHFITLGIMIAIIIFILIVIEAKIQIVQEEK